MTCSGVRHRHSTDHDHRTRGHASGRCPTPARRVCSPLPPSPPRSPTSSCSAPSRRPRRCAHVGCVRALGARPDLGGARPARTGTGLVGGLRRDRGGLGVTSQALRAADRRGIGSRLEATPAGRFTLAAVNGLIGDRLADDHPDLAITLSVRSGGHDVACEPVPLPRRTRRVRRRRGVPARPRRERRLVGAWCSRGYAARLAAEGAWTPVVLRANTGLPIADNGVALASLLDDLVASWPVPVRRVALVGHSMGGLVMRAACAVVTEAPHPLARPGHRRGHAGHPSPRRPARTRRPRRRPGARPGSRVGAVRSDPGLSLDGDPRPARGPGAGPPPVAHARYRLVAATLAGSRRHPVSLALGDLLVRYPSAVGRPRRGPALSPMPTYCTCAGTTSTCSTTRRSTRRSGPGSREDRAAGEPGHHLDLRARAGGWHPSDRPPGPRRYALVTSVFGTLVGGAAGHDERLEEGGRPPPGREAAHRASAAR